MAFKSEIHVAELASIRTGHTEGDIYCILDNGILGDLPCKPGTFVKWHNNAWQILPDEHYALGSAVDAGGGQVEVIGNPLQWKGPATVSELNDGIENIQPGWTYTLTNAGTLIDGKVTVDVGDEVAWTENGEWFKIGGEGGVKILHGYTTFVGTTYPHAEDVINAVKQGKDVIILWNQQGHLYIYSLVYVFGYSSNGDKMYIFRCLQDQNEQKTLSVSDGVGTWSRSTINSIALPNSVADLYSNTSTYSVGDTVMYGGLRYVCKTAITVAEEWTSSHWESESVQTAMGSLSRTPTRVFVEPPIYFCPRIMKDSNVLAFNLRNVPNGFSLALIGLTTNDGSYVSAGDIFELVTNGFRSFNYGTLLSMGLFKMVGHTVVGGSWQTTFRRLTATLAPRSLAGVRNDGGVPPYGQEPVAANPIRFTFDERAQFDKGELLYLGIAEAYDSSQATDASVFICESQQLPVKEYYDPMSSVGPVYYAYGQSNKIGVDGFTAREFTIGDSNADFDYAETLATDNNAYELSAGGTYEVKSKTYPTGFKLVKYKP